MSSGRGESRSWKLRERESVRAWTVILDYSPFIVPPFLVLFFLLRRRLSWQYWTQFPWRKAEPESFHHFIHWGDTVEKGPSWPLAWSNNKLSFYFIYGFMRMLFRGWPITDNVDFPLYMRDNSSHVIYTVNYTSILHCFGLQVLRALGR